MAERLPHAHSVDPAGPTALISLDSYYHALSRLAFEERVRRNFDHPDSLDWELVHSHLDLLRRGRAFDEPICLFDRRLRSPETRRGEASPFMILEGLHDERVRRLLDARIFVNAPRRGAPVAAS